MLYRKICFFVVCCVFLSVNAAESGRQINMPGYKLTANPNTSIILEISGKKVFSDKFFVHKEKGKPSKGVKQDDVFLQISGNEQEKKLVWDGSLPGLFKYRKELILKPNKISMTISLECISETTVQDREYNLLLSPSFFAGAKFNGKTIKSHDFNGSLSSVAAKQSGLPEGVLNIAFAIPPYNVSFAAGKGQWWSLIDSRLSRWARSFRLMETKHNVKPASKQRISFEITFNQGVKTTGVSPDGPMEVGQLVSYTPLDISGVCNMGFTENDQADDGKGGWTDQGGGGNDFREFPVDKQVFGGVPFSIVDPAKNNGKSCLVLGGLPKKHLPKEITIPVNQRSVAIYFLQTCGWGDRNERIAEYRIVYDDGSETVVPLVYGRDITGWWSPKNTANSVVAWQGKCAKHAPIGINIFGWNNPNPQKIIRSIKFTSAWAKAVPIMAGITLSNIKVTLRETKKNKKITDTSNWVPFVPVWDDISENATSVKYLNDAPAGKHGFVQVKDGHFYFEDGTRARFWGGALVTSACFVDKQTAEKTAQHLAKIGFNIVRMHIYDSTGFTGNNKRRDNIFGHNAKNSLKLDAEYLDKLDYLIWQMKKNGIYVYLDIQCARYFTEKDGVVVEQKDKFGNSREKRGVYIDRRTIELIKQFATQLFTHRNPYTKLRYCDDPAIAMLDMVNENTLFLFGYWWKFTGYYKQLIDKRWNDWLKRKYKSTAKLRDAWGKELRGNENLEQANVPLSFPVGAPLGSWGGEGTSRQDDEVQFICDVQMDFYNEMEQHLRKIGIKIPVCGSHPLYLNIPNLWTQATLDFIDQHPYAFGLKSLTKTDVWDYDTITQMALSKIAGKPLVCTEWNYHHKDIFAWRSDAPLFVAAYSRFQDWDCIIVHGYNHSKAPLDRILWNQNVISDPVFIGQWQAASNIFLRGDVSVAKEFVDIGRYYQNTYYKRSAVRPSGSFLPFVKGVQTRFYQQDETPELRQRDNKYLSKVLDFKDPGLLRSDTGELLWDHNQGTFSINTAKTQALVGYLKKFDDCKLQHLDVQTPMEHVLSISLTSLDSLDITLSKRMLLTAAGRSENTGMVWDSTGFTALNKGKGPVLIEPVEAVVRVRNISAPEQINVYSLNKTGERTGKVELVRTGSSIEFKIGGKFKTMYYEIARK